MDKWKTGPKVNYNQILASGNVFTDSQFPTYDAEYWADYNNFN